MAHSNFQPLLPLDVCPLNGFGTPSIVFFLTVIAGLVLLKVKVFNNLTSDNSNLPRFNGPRGLPLLGNILQIRDQQWLQYTEWHKTYGPIFSLNFVGQPVLVIGDAKIAADLMDRRSFLYSDRPRFIMATEILTGGMNLAFAPWGNRWKKMRKAANVGLSANACLAYTTLQEREARCFLRGLLSCHGKIDSHIRRNSASMVLSAVYAYPPLPPLSVSHDGCDVSEAGILISKVEDYVSRMLKAALPGNYLVDLFPWMMWIPAWFPGAGWKREGYEWFKKDTNMFFDLVRETETALTDGTRGECFVSKLLESSSQHDLNPVETAWLAGMMFGAGTEALAATLSFFVLAMILFPHVQDKLREEIDRVVGSPGDNDRPPRFPTFEDTQNMPFLHAVMKEVMRWRPMGPMAGIMEMFRRYFLDGARNSAEGVPHRSVQDDVYDGHFIPAGTLIFPNVWAMHHDERVYPDAHRFRPERFLAEDGVSPALYPDTKDLGHHGFGFGRRMCSGYHVATNAFAINAAHIVWAFRISKANDSHGREITPNPDALLDEGLAVRPLPFDCAIEPRSPAILKMLSHNSEEP